MSSGPQRARDEEERDEWIRALSVFQSKKPERVLEALLNMRKHVNALHAADLRMTKHEHHHLDALDNLLYHIMS